MKLLVFGSTGGTGRQLVELALARGHAVTAFARNPAKLDIRHANLKVVQGDVMDFASVEKAVQGQEAVLSALGSPAWKNTAVRSDGTQHIVCAMEEVGVRRFVSLSTLGAGIAGRYFPSSTSTFFSRPYCEMLSQLMRIKKKSSSRADWIGQSSAREPIPTAAVPVCTGTAFRPPIRRSRRKSLAPMSPTSC